jgi:hypothetical protein
MQSPATMAQTSRQGQAFGATRLHEDILTLEVAHNSNYSGCKDGRAAPVKKREPEPHVSSNCNNRQSRHPAMPVIDVMFLFVMALTTTFALTCATIMITRAND